MTGMLSRLIFPMLKGQRWGIRKRRLLAPVTLVALLAVDSTRMVTLPTLSDAFWQVAAYVAATLALFHFLSERFDRKGKLALLMSKHSNLQVVFASFMGALPGCGGAIVVITQYVRGNLSFGSVVAVLTATMGDAAFLLLATKPSDGIFMIGLGFAVGLVSGRIVDALHGANFMRLKRVAKENPENSQSSTEVFISNQGRFWQWLVLPALLVSILGSMQMNPDEVLHLPVGTTEWLGAALAVISVTFWALQREADNYESVVGEDPKCRSSHLFQRVAKDTNFVIVWVIAAFLMFELIVLWLDIDLAGVFSGWAALMPLMGVVVGFLPGCGPQILVTSLYVSGAIPMSAQIGNAISNDGDALFPAIALAPKAAIVATLYSSVPALIAAYSYFWLVES
ncbi:putative manganese transporter [Grimontia sp. NTOU-MAR1]|uniref:putative manganese transporter n=1 Tax=Grimontia sp. NTOU-MAR1 TaxID=3111011 RepID=UPI002DBFD021|nr:putative manganese transporter [Grimontia sp. NTOU-MAR1]WRV99012.1 putative manganese transporter [Grimontia sp. NTOU-MAR1]